MCVVGVCVSVCRVYTCMCVCLFCPLFHIADVSFDYLFLFLRVFRFVCLMFEVSSIFMNKL